MTEASLSAAATIGQLLKQTHDTELLRYTVEEQTEILTQLLIVVFNPKPHNLFTQNSQRVIVDAVNEHPPFSSFILSVTARLSYHFAVEGIPFTDVTSALVLGILAPLPCEDPSEKTIDEVKPAQLSLINSRDIDRIIVHPKEAETLLQNNPWIAVLFLYSLHFHDIFNIEEITAHRNPHNTREPSL